jgi:hypothetical protein
VNRGCPPVGRRYDFGPEDLDRVEVELAEEGHRTGVAGHGIGRVDQSEVAEEAMGRRLGHRRGQGQMAGYHLGVG